MGVSNIKNGAIYPTKNFGDVEVVNYVDKYHIDVKFINTGGVRTVTAVGLRKGFIVDYDTPTLCDVGYIGYGVHNTRKPDGKSKTRAYEYWSRMLRRCYDKEGQDYPMYGEKGVIVCKEWHDFQNFSEWFIKQKNHDKKHYHLDKDLTTLGNRVYCPEGCNIVPPAVNLLGINNCAVKFSRTSSGKWRYSLPKGQGNSGSYATRQDCLDAYLPVKRASMITIIAENFLKGEITKVMYENLIAMLDVTHPLSLLSYNLEDVVDSNT